MELFKRKPSIIEASGLRSKFVAIIGDESEELPSVEWAQVIVAAGFVDLVRDDGDRVVIYCVRDDVDQLAKVRLVAEHPSECEVQITQVQGITQYVPSTLSTQCFWNCPSIQFSDWMDEAIEAERSAELARRSSLDRDERKKEDAARDDGTYKRIEVTKVDQPDEAEFQPVL